ncbi:MAG: hypothetical protein JW741_11305 [Sedimentisphaerales bacterium]|nr:hypothetical protein [Sedimentisphaerales bacterium]
MRTRRWLGWFGVVPVIPSCCLNAAFGEGPDEMSARQILEATGVRAGLIVHLGCGNGRLTAGLCQSDAYRVHGLDAGRSFTGRRKPAFSRCQ